MKMLAVDTTADIMAEGSKAFEEENDLEFAEASITGNLKVLEGLLKSSPENKTLLLLLSKSYGGYAFAFLEDHYEELKPKDLEKAEYYKKRAGNFYLRGKDFGMRLLTQKNSNFEEILSKDFQTFEKEVSSFGENAVEALFWGGYNWGNWVNMNLHSPEAIVVAPKVERMMARVLELDEKYYYGGPHLFYGVYYGGRPPMLGGDLKKSKEHFEKALKFTQRKFLMTQVLYAQYYAVQSQDQVLFTKLLTEVLHAKDDILPEQNLITQLAKKKARRLLARRGDLF